MSTEIQLATVRHIEDLLPLIAEYHEFEGVRQDEPVRRSTIAGLLMTPDFGYAWLIRVNGNLAGYIAVCLGYSIEFGGKDGFIDEFYLLSEYRGRGVGKEALAKVLDDLRQKNVKALHLEVALTNTRAQELYKAEGFELRDRYCMMSCVL